MYDKEFAEVARQFSPNEEASKLKQRALSHEIGPVADAIFNIVNELYLKGIRFAVFDMEPDKIPPRIHVGMTMCCEKKKFKDKMITPELRQDIAARIIGQTKYKDVKWAI
jgi:hypothetical protein